MPGRLAGMTRPALISIVDPVDPRVDDYRALRGRESREVLWAEGPTVVTRLLTSNLRARSVLLSPSAHLRLKALLTDSRVSVFIAEQTVINAIVGFDLHRGAIAIADRPATTSLEAVCHDARRLVVLEGINDAENLGAIARSARGLGADGLVLDPTCADPYYRRSVRVSMGEVLHLPIARASLPVLFEHLRSSGFVVWALTPRRAADSIGSLVRAGSPDRLALVVGAEGPGLSDDVLETHVNVRIPMTSGVDSLNVGHAVAAALAVVQSSDA